jgi:hypothetical protein
LEARASASGSDDLLNSLHDGWRIEEMNLVAGVWHNPMPRVAGDAGQFHERSIPLCVRVESTREDHQRTIAERMRLPFALFA